MAMGTGIFVVGDVHGCLHTFVDVLKRWNTEREMLVQVGDLVVGGNYSPEVVALARRLEQQYPGQVVFLRGNHEQQVVEYFERQMPNQWLRQGGSQMLHAYARRGFSLANDVEWFNTMPLFWENNAVFISHAGVGPTDDPYNPRNPAGVVWYRGPLQHIGKLQVVGHVPVEEPTYSRLEHCWRIDTNARRGHKLSALRLDAEGTVLEIISIPVHAADFSPPSSDRPIS
ncbi:MAG: metallophosphoesterase [Bacteroidota bacterium]|nr:metallophosphoesterase [Candidatus Kapabacteria bacterium]MCS7303066.1 metallophosphoesterase [Candidatus Kapabacteria bacterium]MCX7937629.1 metallophosphoesterase [Chlorobiota bacterium]MDW8075209.1 metallophosphoesterase [Bacteroidota bacterium]MDW8272441.1 metallophosphoesterase [Bacteroidota bacterium]